MEALLNGVMGEVLQWLIAAAVTGLVGLIGVIFDKYRLQRLGLKKEFLQSAARTLVLAAEEKIEALAKKGAISVTRKGDAKLEAVVSGLMDKFPNVSREEANVLAHEAVATVGLGAASFLANLLRASQSVEAR